MLIAIFDMDMPKKCTWDCPFCNGEGGWCQLADIKINNVERPKECPLHEIDEKRVVR